MHNRYVFLAAILVTIAAVALPASQSGAAPAQAGPALQAAGLVGAWSVTYPAARPTARQLMAFNADGVFSATNYPTLPPGPEGPPVRVYSAPGYGAWAALEDGQYAATLITLIFGEDGRNAFSLTEQYRLALDASGDTFRGEYLQTITDATGSVLVEAGRPVPVVGTRIRL